MFSPTLCLDFDGVIHRYSKGWQNGEIYDDATDGFFEWLHEAVNHFTVVIYSSRSKTPEGIAAMQLWMDLQYGKWVGETFRRDLNPDLLKLLTYASEKPAAFLTIDDRAIRFRGSWSELEPKKMLNFKPWNMRP